MEHKSFEEWWNSFEGTSPENNDLEVLARIMCASSRNAGTETLFDSLDFSIEQLNCSGAVSWDGVSARWFLDVFIQSSVVQDLMKFDCPMWFFRNFCVRYMTPELPNGRSCCLVDVLRASKSGTALVAKPTVFISYTGNYSLQLFVQLLKDLDDHFLWSDVFCVDQIAWKNQTDGFKDAFMYRLQENVTSIGHTVLLLRKWDSIMDALGMIWVLWEIFAVVESKGNLDILLTDAEHQRFIFDGINTKDGLRSIFVSLGLIDARNAKARYQEDTERILQIMDRVGGVSSVNEKVIKCLRHWFVETASELHSNAMDVIHTDLDGAQEEIDAIKMCHNMARLYAQLGDFAEAVRLERKVVAGFTRLIGSDSAATLLAKGTLGGMLREQNEDLNEAEELLRSVLQARLEKLGPNHTDTLISANNYGNVLMKLEKFEEAREVYANAQLALSRQCNDASDSNFVLHKSLLSNIAVACSELGEYDDALEKLTQVKNMTETKLGPRHGESLRAVGNIASLLDRMGNPERSVEMYRANLIVQREVFGVENPQTLHIMHCLSFVLFKIGNYEEAESICRETVSGRTSLLGPNHIDTVKSNDVHKMILAITEVLSETNEVED